MKTIFVHGYGSNNQSSKFIQLKKHYPNIICFEWDNSPTIVQDLINFIDNPDELLIIGDSTGCNFIGQLNFKDILVHKVFISPLFTLNQIKVKIPYTKNQLKQLKDIDNIRDSMLILPDNDDVLNYEKLPKFIRNNNGIYLYKNKNHRFSGGLPKDLTSKINDYVSNVAI